MQGPAETRSTQCSICLEVFRDPRLLPCGHTFCTLCLQRLVDHCQPSYSWPIRGFACPLCRTFVLVPAAGAQGFPTDAQMAAELVNRRALSSGNSSRTHYYFGFLFLVIAFLIYTLFQSSAEMAAERKTWAFEKHGYEVSEELLRKQIQALIAKEKRDSLPTEGMYRNAGRSKNKVYSIHGTFKRVSTMTPQYGHLTMSIIHNELFVFNPDTSRLEIRDRATLKTKSSLTVSNFYSIAGKSFCKENKYIYVSTTRKTILKFDSDGDIVAKWSTGDIKGRPSLTADCNVAFIPHDGTTIISIFTPYGDLFRIIQLKLNIGGARLNCAVQLPNGNFVVSYGTDQDKQHGVSLTDSKGNVLRSFGGIKGEGTNRVNGVYDMIADESGNVYAVDHNNHRILRLNSDLEYVNEFVSAESGLRFLHGAIFDEMHGRLFVMGSTWDDTISNLSPGKIFVYETQG